MSEQVNTLLEQVTEEEEEYGKEQNIGCRGRVVDRRMEMQCEGARAPQTPQQTKKIAGERP